MTSYPPETKKIGYGKSFEALITLAETQGVCFEKSYPKHSSLSVLKKLYLFIEQLALYDGIPEFLHLFFCCMCKTSFEYVVENMGSIEDRRARGRNVSSTTRHSELLIQ